jgi:hypothetical protein
MLLKARGWVLLSGLLAGTAWGAKDSPRPALERAGLPKTAQMGVFAGPAFSDEVDRAGWIAGTGITWFLGSRLGIGFELAFLRRPLRQGSSSSVRIGAPFRWELSTGQARPYLQPIFYFESHGTPVSGAGLGMGVQLDLPLEGAALDVQVQGSSRLSFVDPRLTMTGTLGLMARW